MLVASSVVMTIGYLSDSCMQLQLQIVTFEIVTCQFVICEIVAYSNAYTFMNIQLCGNGNAQSECEKYVCFKHVC